VKEEERKGGVEQGKGKRKIWRKDSRLQEGEGMRERKGVMMNSMKAKKSLRKEGRGVSEEKGLGKGCHWGNSEGGWNKIPKEDSRKKTNKE